MKRVRVALAAIVYGAAVSCASAQGVGDAPGRPSEEPPISGAPETSERPDTAPAAPSIASSLGPLGDPGGVRSRLEQAGITANLVYIGEALANARGGLRKGGAYQGRLEAVLDADLDKLLGWKGASFHTNMFQIHGRGLSRYFVGNLLTTSGIEALPATRLYELWFEQKLLEDRVSIRAGQLAADTEFLVSQYGGLFVNATFGWPAITAANLPSGGPAYPFATPGVRVKLAPTESVSFLAALFNGDPAGPGLGDPQERNPSNTNFRTSDPALVMVEGAYSYNQDKAAAGLPGTIKLGGWHHFGRFDDQRFGTDRLSLADPASSGIARRLRGNHGVYAVFDQLLYREPETSDQGLGMFVRVSGSPSDRNLISFYADGGLTYKGLLPGRESDTFGIGFGYAQIADRARGLDADTAFFTQASYPIRSSEALLEISYQAVIVPGWTVQPDFQYVFRPGGNVPNPRDASGDVIKNAAIFGLRTTIRY